MNRQTGPGPQSSPPEPGNRAAQPGGKLNGRATGPREPVGVGPRETGKLLSSAVSLSGFAQDDPRVVSALEAYLEAIQAGHPCSRDEFLARHSEIADVLGECLSGLEFIQTTAPQLTDAQVARAQLADVMPTCAQLGEYRILREIGRGGMGVVYEAEQVSLGRRVALKVLPFAAAIDPKQRQRFQIEAQAAAQLHHPHIVPIFGVGCDHGIHYYAMQFVEGRSLSAILHELRLNRESKSGMAQPAGKPVLEATEENSDRAKMASEDRLGMTEPCLSSPRDEREQSTYLDALLLPHSCAGAYNHSTAPSATGLTHQNRAFCRNVARLGAEAADALDHAHGLGVVHRDIKPANLLIDGDGALWITDFGLARIPSDLSLTHTGDVVGTLRYMSPEQAQARGGVVDQRADIYALGMTLYELLTLEPAFDGRDHQELLRQIALDEPVPPRKKNPAVPRDLETIVLKAIAKDPSSRYTTAQEFAADLRRFMDGQPILARRPGPLERALRWAGRRKDLVATAAAVLILALVVGSATTVSQIRKTDESLRKKDAERNAWINDLYPYLDQMGMTILESASMPSHEGAAAFTDDEVRQKYEKALSIFQQAIDLPPDDVSTRAIIARAYTRRAYTRWMWSMFKAARNGLEPQLLADAQDDFQQSVTLLEKLLVDSPGDRQTRRYLAEALGFGGQGCCVLSQMREDEALPLYKRSIEIRHQLLRELDTAADGSAAQADLAGERSDLASLLTTIQWVARLLEKKGRAAEANALRRQLGEDVAAVVSRLSRPEFRERRTALAAHLMNNHGVVPDPTGRRDGMTACRYALMLDPNNAKANNNVAWALVSVPADPWFDPAQGFALATKATELEPLNWYFQNTLGVAAYRDGKWETAAEIFKRSTTSTGGAAHDLFFLAMTYWQQGSKKEAREMYEMAVARADKSADKYNPYELEELSRFRAEAAALLGQPCEKPRHEKKQPDCEKKSTATDTAQKMKPVDKETVAPTS
jgi:serine/threonine protein kinase